MASHSPLPSLALSLPLRLAGNSHGRVPLSRAPGSPVPFRHDVEVQPLRMTLLQPHAPESDDEDFGEAAGAPPAPPHAPGSPARAGPVTNTLAVPRQAGRAAREVERDRPVGLSEREKDRDRYGYGDRDRRRYQYGEKQPSYREREQEAVASVS